MPDSFPPDEGPDPYEGQDLDGLLSGEAAYVPEGLRPVVPTLDALRAGPLRAELSGEAAARSEFRKFMLAGKGEPAWMAGGTADSRTLILPTAATDGRARPVPPRHRHRRPPQRGRWQAKAIVGAAAAAVVVAGAAAFASTFTGSGARPVQAGRTPSATSATTHATASGSNGLEGNGKQAPTPTPTPSTHSGTDKGPSPSTLCEEYFASFGHHESRTTENELGEELSSLAGGPASIYDYCAQFMQPWSATEKRPEFYPGVPGPGNPHVGGPQGAQGFQGPQGAHGEGGPPPPGPGGNGNGPGFGGQNHQ